MKLLKETITDRGQTTIPAAVRKALKLKPRQRLTYEVLQDGVLIRPETESLMDLAGCLSAFRHKRPATNWSACPASTSGRDESPNPELLARDPSDRDRPTNPEDSKSPNLQSATVPPIGDSRPGSPCSRLYPARWILVLLWSRMPLLNGQPPGLSRWLLSIFAAATASAPMITGLPIALTNQGFSSTVFFNTSGCSVRA
jgi:antitoxin PrlF